MRSFRLSSAAVVAAATLASPSLVSGQRNSPGDYSLAVVSAVLPTTTSSAGTDVVTLVIENRGSVDAPVSLISVAPRDHLSLARQSSIPTLRPGERTTVRLPVRIADDGTPCISITISSAPIPDPAVARFLAAVIPDPMIQVPAQLPEPASRNWGYSSPFGEVALFGDLSAFGDL